jgi:YVTN family beta-propeller protein
MWYKVVVVSPARRLAGSKYAIAVGALSVGVAVGTTVASAATRVKPIATVRVGSQSGMVLFAAGSIWSSDLLLARVVRIDPATNSVARRIPFAARPFGIAFGAGSVWVADRSVNVLGRIDPRRNKVVKKIRIGYSSYGVAFGAGSVWVTSEADGTVRRISPKKNRVVAKVKVGTTPNGVVYAFGSIWVADLGRGAVVRINPRTNRVTKRIKVAKADWITPSPDALWVSSEGGEVVRLDPVRGAVVSKVDVGANPLGSAWIGGELWVPNIDAGTISLIDPQKNAVRATLEVGSGPLSIATGGGDVWVSNSSDGVLWRVSASQP